MPSFTTTATLPDYGDDPVTLTVDYSQSGPEMYIDGCTITIDNRAVDVWHKLSQMQKWRIEEDAAIDAAEVRIAAQETNNEFRRGL